MDFRRHCLSQCLSLLMSAFALPKPPGRLAAVPSPAIRNAPLPSGDRLSVISDRNAVERSLAASSACADLPITFAPTGHKPSERRPPPSTTCPLRWAPSDHWSLITDLRIQSFGSRLEPRYIFGAETLKFRPVSCYAFFKGWLLLSQPPGCFGISTSFPT